MLVAILGEFLGQRDAITVDIRGMQGSNLAAALASEDQEADNDAIIIRPSFSRTPDGDELSVGKNAFALHRCERKRHAGHRRTDRTRSI